MSSVTLVVQILALCLTLAGVETLHGILRNRFVAPKLGTKRAKRLSVLSGTGLAYLVGYGWVPRLGLTGIGALLGLGLGLAGFMALFDIVLGRYLIKLKWRVILKDFDPRQGNYLTLGLLFLGAMPWVVVQLRAFFTAIFGA